MPWARLLKRVLDIDALTCPRCSTPMVILAFLTDPRVVHPILEHLRLPTDLPPVAPAWLVEDGQGFLFADPDPAWDDPPPARQVPVRPARSPP